MFATRRCLAALAAAAVLLPLAWLSDANAAPRKNSKAKSTPAAKTAAVTKDGVKTLYGIPWHVSLDAALKKSAAKGEAKPVMCFRVLGDIAGFM
jgi:hypothetical protein